MTPLIRLEGVSKSYGAARVVDAMDLEVARGEFLTLLGPSGCGKTTTLRLIAGFEAPDRGRVWLDGADITEAPPHRRPLNTVFQNYALFPHMTVADNIGFGPRMTGVLGREGAARVAEMLELVGLAAHARKRPAQLSGGQQQRVALARALVNRPRALLLDEPLSALDVKLRRALQIELKRIQSAVHTTFVFVTHDQEEALTMSSRIAVMEAGRIAQLGPPEAVYARPASRFVAEFLGEASFLPVEIRGVADGVAHGVLDGVKVAARAPSGAAPGPAWLMLRPEQVRLAAADGLPVRLKAADYQGAARRCELACPNGETLLARVPAGSVLPDAGDTLHASWNADEAWIVPM